MLVVGVVAVVAGVVVVVLLELEVSEELPVLVAALEVAAAVGVLVFVAVLLVDVSALLELAAAVGVAEAVAVGAVVVVAVVSVVLVTLAADRALVVSFWASTPSVVTPTAAAAVSPAVATAILRRPRSLAFTLPPDGGGRLGHVLALLPTFGLLPVRGLCGGAGLPLPAPQTGHPLKASGFYTDKSQVPHSGPE